MTLTIKRIIDNIKKLSSTSVEDILKIPSLENYETMKELEEAFYQLFDDIQELQADKRSSKQSDLIRQINQKINQSYTDPSLGLNQIADELNLSPIYVSRLYKQQTMTAIVDVIMDVRMQEVCRLLKRAICPYRILLKWPVSRAVLISIGCSNATSASRRWNTGVLILVHKTEG